MSIIKANHSPPLLDQNILLNALHDIFQDCEGDLHVKRQAVFSYLQKTKKEMFEKAEQELLENGGGLACVQRLSQAQDIFIICLISVSKCFLNDQEVSALKDDFFTLIAVGGYGRGTLAPQSDLDLLFLWKPQRAHAATEKLIEFLLYMLWDLGYKVGHATRNVDECLEIAQQDMHVRTALLEARFIDGNQNLFHNFKNRFENEIILKTIHEFVQAKLHERDERHIKQGTSRYLVEPNVKESKGGLRDLHTLYWIGKYYYRVQHPSHLVQLGVFSRKEYNRFLKCEDFLWATRCHMHFETKRADERLSFDLQPLIAKRLGYVTHPGLRDVERFMKHYFLCAKDVGDLTRIVCGGIEEETIEHKPILGNANLGRIIAPLTSKRKKSLKGTKDFMNDQGRLNVAHDKIFEEDPLNLIRIFVFFDQNDLGFHPDAMRLITRSLKLISKEMRQNKKANRLFLDILTSRNKPEKTLRRMNEAGVLGRFVRDFGKIVSMMQFNMYHHYTVDEHLLRSIGILNEIEKGHLKEEHPLSHQIIDSVQHRRVLYVALFLHDIAKGRPEDHSIAGARISRRLGPRFGLNDEETELVSWLIEDHLTMSMTAQQRDISDRKTIDQFAEKVQTLERLKLLLILTVADIKAVGPGVWNGWKGQLLRTLYYQTEVFLSGGHSQLEPEKRAQAAKKALDGYLNDWDAQERERFLTMHSTAYWLRVDLESQLEHARLISKADKNNDAFAYTFQTNSFEAITEITILAPDHPRLLALIAGACTVSGADIEDAHIYTTKDGRALDSIFIRRSFELDSDEERRAKTIAQNVCDALTKEESLSGKLIQKKQTHPFQQHRKHFKIPTRIKIDNNSSEKYTIIEAAGLDRAGLLYDLTSAVSALYLNIASAHIATFGERAVDTFYVVDLEGRKIEDPDYIETIRNNMKKAFHLKPQKKKNGKAA